MAKAIKSSEVLYSKGQNDECPTPEYAVTPIVKYIPQDAIVWCPFDKADSNFVKVLRRAGYQVVHSHIDEGKDFFTYQPPKFDVIVSNPPFTNKYKIFDRAVELGKPFALLMTNTWLNDSAPKKLIKKAGLQLLMFEQRIDFQGQGKITYSSSYFCRKLLPRSLMVGNLVKPKKERKKKTAKKK